MSVIQDIGLSALRWFLGLITGCILGIVLVGIGHQKRYRNRILEKIVDFLRAIPIIGLVPIIQMNIGVREYGKIGLIAWGVMFPVWITVRSVAKREFIDLELMLSAVRLKNREYGKLYLFPKLIGGLLNGIDIGIGIAWLCVVASEWVGTYSKGFWSGGLGASLLIEYNNNNWLKVHVYLLLFGALGLLSAFLWKKLKRYVIGRLNGFDPERWLKRG